MGQSVLFDGQLYIEPTSKARIISGVSNGGAASSFGNICIIDTGIGAGYGGGVGAVDSVGGLRDVSQFLLEFNSPAEMKNAVKGGALYDLVDYLYSPSLSSRGASRVFLARAAQTAQGQDSATFDAGFQLVLNTLEEGTVVNGTLNGSDLESGYAWTLEAGVINPAKFIFKFWRGTYRGADGNGFLYDGLSAAEAAENPVLVAQSAEVANVAELIAWANGSSNFQSWFEFDATSATAGTFAAADLTTFAAYQLFAGGTETYNATAIDNVLDEIAELDNTFFFATESGASAAGTNNVKILSHIINEAEFKKFIVIGGGDDAATVDTQSVAAAEALNSRYAIVVHGGIEEQYVLNPTIAVPKGSIYKAAMVVGRLAGLEPQTPLTYKDLRIRSEQHVLTKAKRESLINSGVLHTRSVPQLGIVVNQSINTLQLNDFLINPDGSSPEISVERIEAQLNREIAENARVLFIGRNRGSVTAGVLEAFATRYLKSKQVVQGVTDGLIITFDNVKAERQGTVWYITYDFEANTPINKIFTTGTIVDPSI